MATPTHQRRDAERNHEAIVTAAIVVLADAPEATMAEIAAASGIGRSTVYRHFPDRDALVAAIFARVVSDAEAIVAEHLAEAEGEDPVDVLIDVVTCLSALGDRYRFLIAHGEHRRVKHPDRRPLQTAPLGVFIADAQAAGTLRGDLDPDWLFQVAVHLMAAAAKHEFPDAEARRTAIDATVRSLVSPASEHYCSKS